ncbi:MAG: hypothetical protein Q8P82_03495, partial [bacterium]|nr:hypothetical protein [bacterium]
AVRNFLGVADLRNRRIAFAAKHPELNADPNSTALADLMGKLDAPMEIPAIDLLGDPAAALEHEDALAELVGGGLHDHEIDRKLAALQTVQRVTQ